MSINNYLSKSDPELNNLLEQEATRQQEYISLIPSENYTHPSVREALASVSTNKYSEGYANRRYYHGNRYIDEIELLAIARTKKVFKGAFANVQPYSGSPANLAVYFAFLNPGDKVMGIEISHGGHLTHGARVSFSGKWFQQVPILLDASGAINYEKVEADALEHKPKLILAGVTAYPRELDYARLSKIAKQIDAVLVADISHTNGLVVGGIHKHPFDQGADIITSTTHKMLRGPRGAVIVTNNPEYAQKIDKAIMPGLQGGPHNQQTAAIAVAMKLVDTQEYRDYVQQVVKNAQALSTGLLSHGFDLVSGGTDNHLLVLDLRKFGILGKEAADLLEAGGIVTNANTIPNDPNPPLKPSGIRIGTPAVTTRGMKEAEMQMLVDWIKAIVIDRADPGQLRQQVLALTAKFPVWE